MAEDAARELPNLSLQDALQLVHLYAERGSPKYEKAALRWHDARPWNGTPETHRAARGGSQWPSAHPGPLELEITACPQVDARDAADVPTNEHARWEHPTLGKGLDIALSSVAVLNGATANGFRRRGCGTSESQLRCRGDPDVEDSGERAGRYPHRGHRAEFFRCEGSFSTSGGSAMVITRWSSTDSPTAATAHVLPSRTRVSPSSARVLSSRTPRRHW